MATESPTRRRVLAAMGALPIVGLAGPAIAQAQAINAADWEAGLAAYRRARAAQDAQHETQVMPLVREHDRMCERFGRASPQARAVYEALQGAGGPQRRFDALVSATGDILDVLLETPAPTCEALATKIQLMIDEDYFNCHRVHAVAIMLVADARRFGGEA